MFQAWRGSGADTRSQVRTPVLLFSGWAAEAKEEGEAGPGKCEQTTQSVVSPDGLTIMQGSSEVIPEDSIDGQGPSKRPKFVLLTFTFTMRGRGGKLTFGHRATPNDPLPLSTNGTSHPAGAALPIPPSGADPTPLATSQPLSETVKANLEPPPAIEGMPPLSNVAMASFASAAKGVTTAEEGKEGLLVLNGAAA